MHGWSTGRVAGAIFFLVVLAGVLAPAASAHVPFLEPARSSDAPAAPGDPFPGAVAVPDASISRAVYGTLAPGETLDVYKLSVSRAASTPVALLVPKAGRYRGFRPSFALVGPGVPQTGATPGFIDERLRKAYAGVLFPAGPAPGVLVVNDPGRSPRPTFYEPFSFTSYFKGGSTQVELRPGRTYYLVVFDPLRQTGAYALGIGEAETFSAGDALRSIVAVARIKLGLYGQGAFDTVNAAILAALVVAAVALVVLLVRRRRRWRRTAVTGVARPGVS
jgi:hypothetical protein